MADLKQRPAPKPAEIKLRETAESLLKGKCKANPPEPVLQKSLLCLTDRNPLRYYCKKIVESKTFEYFILITIAVNCIVLMLDSPLPENDTTELNMQLELAEKVFVVIYCLEAATKIIAMGFVFHPHAYLRNGWNILDFAVVIVGLVGLIWDQVESLKNNDLTQQKDTLKVLRAARVLRPLKIVSGIPSLQVVMKTIWRAMVPLLQILVLILFVIVIYAIIGLELLKGKFHYTCYQKENPDVMDRTFLTPEICAEAPSASSGRPCPTNYTCARNDRVWPGPNKGITNFDNIFLSMLTVFQCITMEGWTDIMYHSYDARDYNVRLVTSIIYISLIMIGSFFMLNLVLGVLSGEFAKERERVEHRRKFFKLRRQQQMDRMFDDYTEWISKAEDIMLREDREQHGVGEGGPRDPLKKRYSLSDSIMHLIEDHGEIMKHLKNKRKSQGALSWSERSVIVQKFTMKERILRAQVRSMVKTSVFYWGVLLCVFLNTVIMLTEHYDQPDWLNQTQEISEKVFLGIFIVEMILKLYGLEPRNYFNSAFNRFDFIVVLSGIVEMFLERYFGLSFGSSVLRSLRLLRVFKFTRVWSSLRNLVTSLLKSMRSILSLIFLLLLFIFIFALLGMQLFGGKFSTRLDAPRTNFDSFVKAMLAVFQIMTGEDWNTVMYDGIEAAGGAKTAGGILASLYFVALVIIGNYTLLNVFLAIAVDNLANAQALTRLEEEDDREREQNKKRRVEKRRNGGWAKAKQLPMIMAITKINQHNSNNPFPNSKPVFEMDHHSPRGGRFSKNSALRVKITEHSPSASSNNGRISRQDTTENEREDETEERESLSRSPSPSTFSLSLRTEGRIMRRRNIQRTSIPIIRKSSMFIFGPDNPVRRFCHWLVNLRYFDTFILVIILISSVLLAVEDPVDNKSEINKILGYCDYVITAIFALEVVTKMIDLGVIVHKGSYLRDWWNVIDAFVVVCNITALVLNRDESNSNGNTSSLEDAIKSFRVLRVLRPLKAINKLKSLKTVFQCMVFSLKNVRNILIITALFYFIFAVIGVQLFKGKFFFCTDSSKKFEKDCKGYYFKYSMNREVSLNKFEVKERKWKKVDFHFDSVPLAMLTLFSSSTGEGWPIAMYHTVDATNANEGPRRDNNLHMSIYYVCFVVVFSFFFLNIFVALIIVTFQEQGEKEMVGCELNRNQRDCIQFAMTARPRQRYMPKEKTCFYKVWQVVDSKPFEIFIMTMIVLNAGVLMMSYDKSSTSYDKLLEYVNMAFTFVFLVEAILKLIAFKLNYFRDYWNIFDFIIVVATLVEVLIELTKVKENGESNSTRAIDPSFFRLFRAARLVKLLRQGYTIRILLWTFFQSFKALPYVVILIALLFFVYAVIGMQLFGRIKPLPNNKINMHNHFQSFLQSLLVLFRSATGENWHLVMLACFDGAECQVGQNCGSTIASIIYFCTFYFFCSFLMLNLFVAVIMDNFEYLTRDESILGPHHLDEFVRVWSEYDRGATGRIKHTDVYKLMCDMSPPVGFGKKCPKFIAYKRLIKMNMPIMGDNTVLFTATLFALIRTSLGIFNHGDPSYADSDLRRTIKKLWPKTSKKTVDKMLPLQSVLSSQQMTVGKIYCAKLIYENYKQLKKKRLEDGKKNKPTRRPSLFKRIFGALISGTSNSDDDYELRPPPPGMLTHRRRSKTMDSIPTFSKEKLAEIQHKRRMHRSLKFFRRPFGRTDSNSEDEEMRRRRKSVRFKDAPMDLTDINPTIISTDNEDDDQIETTQKKKKTVRSYKNPVAIEDARNEIYSSTDSQQASQSSSGIRSPPLVRIHSSSPLTLEVDSLNQSTDDGRNHLRLDPFPDVIKSAESSPRHSLASTSELFARARLRDPRDQRSSEIINQLNEEISHAVRSGQSAYCIFGMFDNDEETWC